MDLKTTKVLVTGAGGWLGQGVINALVTGLPEVPLLAQADPNLSIRSLVLPGEGAGTDGNVTRIEGDIRNPRDLEAFFADAEGAVVLHLAGVIHPKKPAEFEEINAIGTRNVLTAAKRAKVRRVVYMSSNSPIGVNPHHDHLFDEASPYNPYMGYGRSKMHAELEVKRAQGEGLETVIVRAPWFYGPFQPARQSEFFEMVRDGKGPLIGGGQNRRSMSYIDNLAQGLLLAAAVDAANGEVYWIADEQPYTMAEILDTIEKLLETEFNIPCKHKRLKAPGLVADVAEIADWGLQKAGLYNQKIHVLGEMNKSIACDVSKAKAELGYRPTVALEEGMRRSIAWAIAQGQL
jgi:nucleoside-diphosphate-sugar epimerase